MKMKTSVLQVCGFVTEFGLVNDHSKSSPAPRKQRLFNAPTRVQNPRDCLLSPSMPKFFHGGHYDDEPDTVPSRLGELTLRSRLEREEQYRNGWRRNLSIAALVVIACVAAVFMLR